MKATTAIPGTTMASAGMDSIDEHTELLSSISSDERALSELREQEENLLEQIAKGGFSSATERENILSEVRLIEGRLSKNKKRFRSLKKVTVSPGTLESLE